MTKLLPPRKLRPVEKSCWTCKYLKRVHTSEDADRADAGWSGFMCARPDGPIYFDPEQAMEAICDLWFVRFRIIWDDAIESI